MASTLVGFSKTRVTELPEHHLGTTVIDGPFVYTYVRASVEHADEDTFGVTSGFVTDDADVTPTHANKVGATVPVDSYFWATGLNLTA